MAEADIHRKIEAVWRIEQAKLIASLARFTRDLGIAEELAQDALVAALERWPVDGLPERPGAWLMMTAKHRAIDQMRRRGLHERKESEIALTIETDRPGFADYESALDDDIGDDLLGLIFIACHPVLTSEARIALTLRFVAGLGTAEIARAFLVPEPTIAQRLLRAKRKLAEAQIAFELPRGEARAERLSSVLQVLYLIFNEGYAATAGADWMRPVLSEEALRLGRILVGLAPQDSEVHGLVALMELQASRFAARIAADGTPILLLDQNRARWDWLLIRRGLAALARAGALRETPGPYEIQAAIAACHARAKTGDDTDWAMIAELYAALARLTPSPVIELNRAVAVSFAQGPAAGLALVDRLADEPQLKTYHLLPAVRGDILAKLGRHEEARREFTRAATLTANQRERDVMLARAKA
jgi:RNA polymerase sigma factor (sigma-70 family)